MRKRVFFVGIGGYGLSAIARLVHEKGYAVSGSDRQLSPLAQELRNAGITVYEGHDPSHIVGADLVVRSSAISDENAEIMAARRATIPVLKRSEFLGEIMENQIGIAVAGTHGKTTTTAMIAWVLAGMDQDPSYIIGGVSKNLGLNAHAGQGEHFVIEADEYDRMFLGLKPMIAIITNVEHDHPDCFPTALDYQQAFAAFTRKVNPQGYIALCGDDPGCRSLLPLITSRHSITYGLEDGNEYQAVDIQTSAGGGYCFRCIHHSPAGQKELAVVELLVPGLHNVRNALAALLVAHRSGLDLQRCARLLHLFSGTGRRFDIFGEVGGITLIDDYAHHPTEIRATLEAARSRFPERRIWVVWQPHTYSRTITLLDQFIRSFDQADHVIVSEIFASRETNQTISGAQIVAQMAHPHTKFIAAVADIAHFLSEELRSGDVVIVLSAGDADQINPILARELIRKEGAR